jgi:hypothetical protein
MGFRGVKRISCLSRSLSRGVLRPDFQFAVIGAGVVCFSLSFLFPFRELVTYLKVGLAVAAQLALLGPTVVLEKNSLVTPLSTCTGCEETSSRNSEVIHAGLYYPPESLKTRLCVEGKVSRANVLNSRNSCTLMQ